MRDIKYIPYKRKSGSTKLKEKKSAGKTKSLIENLSTTDNKGYDNMTIREKLDKLRKEAESIIINTKIKTNQKIVKLQYLVNEEYKLLNTNISSILEDNEEYKKLEEEKKQEIENANAALLNEKNELIKQVDEINEKLIQITDDIDTNANSIANTYLPKIKKLEKKLEKNILKSDDSDNSVLLLDFLNNPLFKMYEFGKFEYNTSIDTNEKISTRSTRKQSRSESERVEFEDYITIPNTQGELVTITTKKAVYSDGTLATGAQVEMPKNMAMLKMNSVYFIRAVQIMNGESLNEISKTIPNTKVKSKSQSKDMILRLARYMSSNPDIALLTKTSTEGRSNLKSKIKTLKQEIIKLKESGVQNTQIRSLEGKKNSLEREINDFNKTHMYKGWNASTGEVELTDMGKKMLESWKKFIVYDEETNEVNYEDSCKTLNITIEEAENSNLLWKYPTTDDGIPTLWGDDGDNNMKVVQFLKLNERMLSDVIDIENLKKLRIENDSCNETEWVGKEYFNMLHGDRIKKIKELITADKKIGTKQT